MTVEKIAKTKEFEQKLFTEVERKFLPTNPEGLADLRGTAIPIEQYYLGPIGQPYSLRLRETPQSDGTSRYEVTLKDTGSVDDEGVHRMEVTAEVGSELYEFYRDETVPLLIKLRAEPLPGIVVDFYDDGTIQVESENPDNWQRFIKERGDYFMEVSGDHMSSNEWRAHFSFRRLHNGKDMLATGEELRSGAIVREILAQRNSEMRPMMVHIGGRSGSGKTTIVREVREILAHYNISTEVISTDDYHRGAHWLREYSGGQDWTHWDAPIVYDTQSMACDLAQLKEGAPIDRREIDWSVAEPQITGTLNAPDVLLVEGIYANSADILCEGALSYEMNTPLATCVGRRLKRDLIERPQFADPVTSLAYMLNEAEPAYRAQLSERNARFLADSELAIVE